MNFYQLIINDVLQGTYKSISAADLVAKSALDEGYSSDLLIQQGGDEDNYFAEYVNGNDLRVFEAAKVTGNVDMTESEDGDL